MFFGTFFAKGSERWRLTPQASYRWAPNGNLIAGLRYEKLDIGKEGVCINLISPTGACAIFNADKLFLLDNEKRSAYAQLQLGFLAQDRVQLTLGARYDDHNLYGASFNPRAGVVYRPYSGGALKLLYGTAFREPNVFELTRNANLRPMDMTTYELSFLHQSRHWSNQVSYFLNQARDIFSEVPTVGGGSLFTNAGARNVRGIEDSLKVQWQRWNLSANVAWVNPDDEVVTVASGTRTADSLEVPKWKLNLLLDYTWARNITIALLNHYVDEVETLALDMAGNRELATIDAFWETDLTLTRRGLGIAPGLAVDVSLSVRNLFDADIYHPQVRDVSPLQFKQNGRAAYVSLRARY